MIHTNKQRKILLVIIAILLIINIAMVGVILQKKDPPAQERRQDKKQQITVFLQKEIGFNQQQLVQFDSVSKWHQQKTGSLYDTVRSTKNEQLQQLAKASFNDTAIAAAVKKSSVTQQLVEYQMLYYIKSVRQLCTTAQLPVFDSLFVKVFNRRGDGKRKAK